IPPSVPRPVRLDQLEKLFAPRSPVDAFFLLRVPARVADPLRVEDDAGSRIRHEAPGAIRNLARAPENSPRRRQLRTGIARSDRNCFALRMLVSVKWNTFVVHTAEAPPSMNPS